jgi:hypothetical protein
LDVHAIELCVIQEAKVKGGSARGTVPIHRSPPVNDFVNVERPETEEIFSIQLQSRWLLG